MMYAGDSFLLIAILVWISVVIGPWWVGAILLTVSLILNAVHHIFVNQLRKKMMSQLTKAFDQLHQSQSPGGSPTPNIKGE